MRFDELTGQLPGADLQPVLAVPQGEAITTQPRALDGYVSPSFEVLEWPTESGVLLIEAPGAVGKSVAGEALAEELNWPLVRAEHAQVGSYSLSGLVQDALGFDTDYMQRVAQGHAGLVVDSLDEAHFRAGTQNFLAFLDNIRSVSGCVGQNAPGGRKPSVVILSRSDTAQLVQLAFAYADCPLAHARLAFFDQRGSEKFIATYMTRRYGETKRPEYNVHIAWSSAFARLREQRFLQVMQIVTRNPNASLKEDWRQSEDFLGYAPVLIALAESLAVPNPSAERTPLTEAKADSESGLLLDIVDRILSREQKKFSDQLIAKLRASLPAGEPAELEASQLYRPSEQLIRVLSHVQGSRLVSPPPADLPSALRQAYEESANQFISDHPFIKDGRFASVVFGDYVRAATCMSLDAQACLEGQPTVESRDVGPFFLSFVRKEVPDRRVSEALIEPLLRSWAQETELVEGAEMGASAFLYLDERHGGALVLMPPAKSGGSRTVDDLELEQYAFYLGELSGALQLRGPLKRLSVLSDQGVILGRRSEPLTLGPDVIIAAPEIDLQTETLSIGWSDEDDAVVLSASLISANSLTQVAGSTESLVIDQRAVVPPRLGRYQRRLDSDASVEVPYEDYVGLRAILTSFYSTVHLGLSATRDRMDHEVIRGSADRERILHGLIARGIVSESGGWYTLDKSALDTVGFSLNDAKRGVPGDSILAFLAECRRGA